jgi:hypothetical protein
MHGAIFAFFSAVGALGFFGILFHSGFKQPVALLGAVLMTVYFGKAAAKEFRYERSKRTDRFLAERSRITKVISSDSDLKSVLAKLSSDYRIASAAFGLSLKNGRCRVVDLVSPLTQIRLEIKNDQIRTHEIFPPYGK